MDKLQMPNRQGLTGEQARQALQKYGPNRLQEGKKTSLPGLFLSQFSDVITMVLIVATVVSYCLGEIEDSVTILLILLLNGILGFVQEFRTEKSMQALKKMAAPTANVVRGGEVAQIPAEEIVPGDLVMLETGDRVPADAVILEEKNLQLNESILTGESYPVQKSKGSAEDIGAEHMVYMGTTVTSGRGKVWVTGTGMRTQMGEVAFMMQGAGDSETPLKKKLNRIGKDLVIICLFVCILIIIAGMWHGETLYNMFLSGVSLAVAAIPEGLPAIVTVALAIGVQRMLKQKALVRKLPAVETLGSTTVICSDKTGTLTENKMTVKKVFADFKLSDIGAVTGAGKTQSFLFDIGLLCNNAQEAKGELLGDPTETAILAASRLKGHKISDKSRLDELPFDSDRKCMSIVCQGNDGTSYLYTKGAPDRVLHNCSRVQTEEGVKTLTSAQREEIQRANESMASDAYRVLAFAYKKLSGAPAKMEDSLETDLIFVGLEGMIDPPRQEAAAAIASCYKAGIRPVMITGDHKITATAVAKELGMHVPAGSVMVGEELDALSDMELERKVGSITVFARVSPKHKLRIVQAYKRQNQVVAMTGDGVNDAPALTAADIGVAMGQSGTDVAKEAADMILTDDNFATIVSAVKEGRMIFDNIRKFIKYLLACNLGEILIMGAAAFVGMPLPLIPVQILWVNLVTDGLPALALGVDPPAEGIMERKPRRADAGVFSGGLGSNIVFSGLLIGAAALLSFGIAIYFTHGNLMAARTVCFVTMIITELFYAFECQSEYQTVFEVGIFRNIFLAVAVTASLLLTIAVLYVPFLSGVFKTAALGMNEWLIVLLCSGIEILVSSVFAATSKKK